MQKKSKSDILYIVGENEIIYSAKKGIEYFTKNFKSGTVKCIPEAGHDLIAIKPEYISDKIIQYIKFNEE